MLAGAMPMRSRAGTEPEAYMVNPAAAHGRDGAPSPAEVGDRVVRFEGERLGFTLDVIGDREGVVITEVEDPSTASLGVQVGDRIEAVNGVVVPRGLECWRIALLLKMSARPVWLTLRSADEDAEAKEEDGDEVLMAAMRPCAHVAVATGVHKATGLQPPFAMCLAKGLVESWERHTSDLDRGLEECLAPTVTAMTTILAADAGVQAVTPMPPPFALEAANGIRAALSKGLGDDGTFTTLALAVAASNPTHLTVDAPSRRRRDKTLGRRLERSFGVEDVKEEDHEALPTIDLPEDVASDLPEEPRPSAPHLETLAKGADTRDAARPASNRVAKG